MATVAYRLDCNKGDLIDGKYRVINQIGSGSYGNVFKVEDITGKYYALKLLRLWDVDPRFHQELQSKFEQEYKAARVPSDYLIRSKGFGAVYGNPYLIMEFCENGDMSKLIGKNDPNLPQYAQDILEGLYDLHSAGKIHRDLKPENVLIRNNGHAALTDFGVVGNIDPRFRISDRKVGLFKKRMAQMHGTPPYMAPEMYDGITGGVTYLPTIDIWSFGVMIYEILTSGKFPFGSLETSEDLGKYFNRAKKHDWDSYLLQNVRHGDIWTVIIGKCLIPDYQRRYQNVSAIMRDLNQLIGSIRSVHSIVRDSLPTNISRLIITQGDNLGDIFVLSKLLRDKGRIIRFGRETTNDVVLLEQKSSFVSRHHFTLEQSLDGKFWIIKDGQWNFSERRWVTSTNGTYLNVTKVPQEGLKVFAGDIITVGEYKIKVE